MSVPEAGSGRSTTEKENTVKVLGTFSYPVTEGGHPLKIQVTLIPLGNCHIQFWKKIRKNKNKKTELGETEATCNSHTETTAITAVSQDASSSSIEGLVNCSSSER